MGLGLLSRFGRRERRAHPRQPVHFDIMYGQGDELTLTTAVDMSECGLSFISNAPIPVGTELDMRLLIRPENQEDTIRLKSRVIRSEQKRVGVVFENLKRADRERLHEYMERLSPLVGSSHT